MNITDFIFAVLTETQVDRLIGLAERFVSGVGAVAAILLPALVLYFQKRNARSFASKLEETIVVSKESKEASSTALTVANGHNEKIAALTEIIAKSSQAEK